MGCEYNEIDEPNSEENIIAQSQRKYARNVIITIILLIAGLAIYANPSLQNVKRFIAFSETTTSTTSEDTCGCPDVVTIPDCGNSENPVLGGLDFVQYFSFENESFTGKMGHSKYSETYDGYTFYFLNEKNKEAFKEDPKKYVPQYGGFCSWGMAGEYCPKFAWASDCLGPSGNWGIWTIQNQKLYFFYLQSAKDLFMEDPDSNIAAGDVRWAKWFNSTSTVYNTNCYYSSNTGFIDRSGKPNMTASSGDTSLKSTLPKGAPTADMMASASKPSEDDDDDPDKMIEKMEMW